MATQNITIRLTRINIKFAALIGLGLAVANGVLGLLASLPVLIGINVTLSNTTSYSSSFLPALCILFPVQCAVTSLTFAIAAVAINWLLARYSGDSLSYTITLHETAGAYTSTSTEIRTTPPSIPNYNSRKLDDLDEELHRMKSGRGKTQRGLDNIVE